ncbi:MAG: MFS transporter, partial [Alistipes sp.]|nr:MFS transporter [Alistipes sp.]
MLEFFSPPAPRERLAADKIDKEYRRMRLKVFLGAFFGYAAYYLVRKNLSLAAPGMMAEGLLDKESAGFAMAGIPIAYAFSKFLMGSLSDHSDARKFLVVGLIIASSVMMAVGLVPYSSSIAVNAGVLFAFMLAVGWLSGMGWPPCGRIMAHWFSQNERSFKMSIWNCSHNIGGGSLGLLVSLGIATFAAMGITESWRAAFIFPSVVAICFAAFCWWTLRDTPESCGLPPIEEYRNDYTSRKAAKGEEQKIPFRRLFVDYIFKNHLLWMIAIANVFVYFIRYGVSDWAPTYLQEMQILSPDESRLAFSLFEYAGIPGTIICGWLSSKFFDGRCAPVNVIYMLMVLVGILCYWQAESIAMMLGGGEALLKSIVYGALSLTGFAVYGPIALIGIQALSFVPKNAAGTAAGFVGLFGYLLGDALLSKIVVGQIAGSAHLGW